MQKNRWAYSDECKTPPEREMHCNLQNEEFGVAKNYP